MSRLKIFFILSVALVSCKQVDNPKIQFLKWAQKGTVIENVACKNDPSQSYCLYLPKNYDAGKKYPTIYAFDPHGKGRIPVALLKNTAEKLGFVVIGSNNSRNGLRSEEINSVISSLFSDTQLKISIDSHRLYTVGFSGGARIACMIAQSAMGIKGVIACSAGFQPDGKPLGFQYIGIAGTQDMNYLEVKQLNDFFESTNQPHQFIVFRGKHQWPPEPIVSEALCMLEFDAMRDSLPLINKSLIDEYLNKNLIRINTLKEYSSLDSFALAYSISKRTYQVINGLANVDGVKSVMDELSQKSILQQYLKEQLQLESFEAQKQKEFIAAFGPKPETWWNVEINQLNQQENGLKRDVSKRLLGYISLSCYGYVNGALHYQDWKAAKYFTSIYSKVDPENPDSWYALACYQASTGKPSDAIKSLENAIHFGFSDYSKIKNDPLLMSIRGLPEFINIAKK